MNAPAPTPRTDKWVEDVFQPSGGAEIVPSEFARQLERELADFITFAQQVSRWRDGCREMAKSLHEPVPEFSDEAEWCGVEESARYLLEKYGHEKSNQSTK